MWLPRPKHKHIAQDTLSEYLDGRLQARDLERVEQRLGECDACRLELEELQATVNMMRQLPMATPRRSFVMRAPPRVPVRGRRSPALPVPNWVYAGAASVAALALAVTVSLDASGGLSSDPLRQDVAMTAQAPTVEQVNTTAERAAGSTAEAGEDGSMPPSLAAAAPATDSTSEIEGAAPPSSGAILATPATPATAGETVQDESGGAGVAGFEAGAVPSPTTVSTPSDQPVQVEPGTGVGGGALELPSATAAPSTASASTEDARVPGPQSTTGGAGLANDDQMAKSVTAETPVPVSGVAEPAPFEQPGSETSVWWRVLEVAAGALAVAFLARLAVRWRAIRRYQG